ncbi:MAG: LPS assembly lipoprotein LptE [Pseudomonadota bacterium]
MSLPHRRPLTRRLVLAGAASMVLSACGFQPLYGNSAAFGPVAEELALINVAVIPDRDGQLLRGFLIQSLNPSGRPAVPAYTLEVGIAETITNLGIQRDDTATRSNLRIVATYTLTSAEDGQAVYLGTSQVITSFNILDDQYATIVAQRSAQRGALRELSDNIRTDLALYFARTA